MVQWDLGHAVARSANVLSATRILVLGGDGMLGRMVRLYLAADPDLVVQWTSRRSEAGALRFDAKHSETLSEITQERGRYDYFINCIAILKTEVDEKKPGAAAEVIRVNALFPHALAAAAQRDGSKVLHVSTDAVFAPESGVCLATDRPAPADFYGRSKLLGEVFAPNALSIRCSIIGPNPAVRKGLFEWVLAQPRNAKIPGYEDQLWKGVTTLQFAELCRDLFRNGNFDQARSEGPVHHFSPNAAVTKFQLVEMIRARFRPDLTVEPALGGAINRVLESRGCLRRLAGADRPMGVAIAELSTYIDGPKAISGS